MYKLFMAFRYLRAHKIIYFSIAGVAVGIMAIVIVTSVMSGFSRDMRQRIRGMQSHLVVSMAEKERWIADYDGLCEQIRKIPHVVGAAPRIEYDAWMSTTRGYKDVHLVGIDPAREKGASELEGYFAKGSKGSFDFVPPAGFPDDAPPVVVGSQMPSGRVGLLTAVAGVNPIFCNREFETIGTFHSGMAEYDSTYVLMGLADAQAFLHRQGDETSRPTVNLIAIKVDDYEAHGRQVRDALFDLLHARSKRGCTGRAMHDYNGRCGLYRAMTWEQTRAILLQAVEVEKGIQIIIMFLIVLVAGFNIIAIYTLVVRAKTRDIGILRALGATEGGVTSIFLTSGGLCGLFGSIFGIGLGLLLSFNLNEIADFVRVVSREMNLRPRWEMVAATVALQGALAGLIWTWLAFYRERGPVPWVRMGLSTAALAAALFTSTTWLPYVPRDSYDPALGPAFRWILMGATMLLWLALLASWRLLNRWRRRPAWIFFGFGGTIVLIAFFLAIKATLDIAAGILIANPERWWPGLELFSRQIYYLDRIPVFVDYKALAFIVAITLGVSVVFSIYPAIKAARANPIEAMRDE